MTTILSERNILLLHSDINICSITLHIHFIKLLNLDESFGERIVLYFVSALCPIIVFFIFLTEIFLYGQFFLQNAVKSCSLKAASEEQRKADKKVMKLAEEQKVFNSSLVPHVKLKNYMGNVCWDFVISETKGGPP